MIINIASCRNNVKTLNFKLSFFKFYFDQKKKSETQILEKEWKHLNLGCHSNPAPKNTHALLGPVLSITLYLITSLFPRSLRIEDREWETSIFYAAWFTYISKMRISADLIESTGWNLNTGLSPLTLTLTLSFFQNASLSSKCLKLTKLFFGRYWESVLYPLLENPHKS